MSVFVLQIIAMVTMLIDHLGSKILGGVLIMRVIGRFAFPIYAFLLAECFRHIKDDPERVKKHLKAYLILALVSEVCYDLFEAKPLTIANMMSTQSNMITILLAFIGLMAIDRWKDRTVCAWAAVLATALCSYLLKTNYRFMGVMLVYMFYHYLNSCPEGYWRKLLRLLLIMLCYLVLYHWTRYGFCSWETYVSKLYKSNICWYAAHVPIAALLAGYNGEPGYRGKGYRIFYKLFYPGHLLILGLIRQLIL